ncbi:preprotein translocase subunit SecA [Legionella feeleii]|uniref:Coiled-coil protein n=1 Tax=Legionella feeleii TaxID=453 RepID=A0A0W0U776_9GAMM|nr:preprotein translocase subunit SecA [Legionella feeleii]KTD03583.1 coiled-coil protein [Legionella feeleii]SPX59374.1 coiled-coil protein [Legionella feeleii]
MISTWNAPFIYLKEPSTSFFSMQEVSSYLWSSVESGVIRDASLNFLKAVQQGWLYNNPYEKNIADILAHSNNAAEQRQTNFFWRSKKAHLSLETFAELDGIGNWDEQARLISILLDVIYKNVLNGLTLGIDFREVFLVAEGETPPSHFRPGIDVCVTSVAEYKKKTERLPYQIAKAIFDKFKPLPANRGQTHDHLNQTIVDHYSSSFHSPNKKQGYINYTTPLKDYRYFNSALTGYIHFTLQSGYDDVPPVIALANPADANELLPFLKHCATYNIREVTIVLKGDQYKDQAERQKVFEKTLEAVKESKCQTLVQVVLITKDNIDGNLLALRPITQDKTALFQSLPQEAGYYLSSVHIASATYRNIQASSTEPGKWFKELNDYKKRYEDSKKQVQPGAYILAREASPDTRKSKTLSREQLKSRVRLSLTHQESVAHTQAVNEQVQETHSQAVNEQVQETHSQDVHQELNESVTFSSTLNSSWDLKVNLDGFCKRLASFAKSTLPRVIEKEQSLKQAGYLTEFYLKHHSRRHFYEQLANDDNFRLRIAAKFFGTALIESDSKSDDIHRIKLPHYAIDNMEEYVASALLYHAEATLDGYLATDCQVKESYFFGRTIYAIKLYTNDKHLPTNPPLVFPKLLYNTQPHSGTADEPLLASYSALLAEDEMASLRDEQKCELIGCAERLLKIFQPHPPLSVEEIQALEEQLLVLTRFYFPDHKEEIERLEQFIASFTVHNEDNLKILLQVLIRRHKQGLACFFKLLSFLEERSLLTYFYKVHFQYATDISSVEQLLANGSYAIFLKLAAEIPVGESPKNWPAFQTLGLHLLLYTAQNNISFERLKLHKLESLWKRLYIKFMAYTGNEEEAQQLLTHLAKQLISENGLSIAPFTTIQTFFIGLENLLDHAMAKHVLKEQIDEIQGVSLLPMDAPYACTGNGFQVISAEMNIHSAAIHPITKTYAVSKTELFDAIASHQPGEEYLKVVVFRYLGTQPLREDLAFYRNLYQVMTQNAVDDNTVYISELLCAYYVATTTGGHYRCNIEPAKFSANFIDFLRDKGFDKIVPSIQVAACIHEFSLYLSEAQSNEINGVQSLWSIWRGDQLSAFRIANTPIPEIFLRKFPAKKLGYFLLTQKESLEKSLGALEDSSRIVHSLLHAWLSELNISETYRALIGSCLKALYPKMDMKTLLRDINKITSLLHALSALANHNPNHLIFLAFDQFLEINSNVDAFLALAEITAVELAKHQGQLAKSRLTTNFLLAIRKKPLLYGALPQAKNLVSLLLETCLSVDAKVNPASFFNLIETLLPLGLEEAQQIFTALIPLVGNEEGLDFLNAHLDLSANQLKDITQFLKKVKPASLALKVLDGLYQQNPAHELTELIKFLEKKPEDEIHSLLILGHAISQQTKQPLLTELQKLAEQHPRGLKYLARLHKSQLVNADEMLELLAEPSLEQAIAVFHRAKYKENLQRYQYDPVAVRAKIAQIKLKSHETDEPLPLSDEQQELLWRDYQLVMSYMAEKPLKLNINGVLKELTINDLNDSEFQHLFKALQDQISKGINVHRNQLLLVALSAEAIYRTTYKFPRDTQILTLLQRIHSPNNIIHEVKTGEGKSIIAAMHAVLLVGLGKTVDVVTENNELAKNALEKFSSCYHYLGIPHGETIITAQSAHAKYTANGINYSTASNLSLFRMRMALAKKLLPNNPALVADEIDAALTSTVLFRLAASLDPLLNDTESWAQLYKLLLEFVKEKEIYLNNPCAETDDIVNLRNYFIAKNPRNAFVNFTQKISDELLGALIESATITHELEEKEDFFTVKIKEKSDVHSYAAPIVSSRPDPHVSYSDYIQQLLHTLLNNKTPPPAHPFIIEPSIETIIVNAAKIFFDYYRLRGGPIVGLTATSGPRVDRTEFYEQQGLVAYRYPTFYPDQSEDLGLITAFGAEDHLNKTFEWLTQRKQKNPAQPILLITRSPQATEQFRDFIARNTDWKVQSYHGYEETGKSEENVIYTAGLDYFLTAANQSLARGADVDPENEDGILVVNACTDLTPSELEQIQGRAARNGKKGQFISIIDAQGIGQASDSPETLAAAFKNHQLQISLQQHQERAKIRLLEEARYLMVDQLLQFRANADKILAPQFGEEHSIVDYQQLLRALSTLNRNAEKHYAELLEHHHVIDGDVANEFLEARARDYQQVLESWLPENRVIDIEFVEPSIPLNTLPTLVQQLPGATVDQLRIFADLFHCKWKQDGHQVTQQNFDTLDQVVKIFDPYFKKELSLKETIGSALDEKGLLSEQQIEAQIILIKTSLDEMLEFAQTIPVIGRFVPVDRIKTFVADYLDKTKIQLREKRWNEVNLPTIDLSTVTSWFSGISSTLTAGSLFMNVIGGPIPFIVNRLILPTVFAWIKNALKRRFADSEWLVAQILVGLDDISKDVSETVNAFVSLANEEDIKVGQLIDKIGPLTKNKALLLALSKYLELTGKPEYIPWVQAIPGIWPVLENYRDSKVDALLNANTLMVILQHASHSELVLNALEDSPYKSGLQKITQLNPNFISQLGTLALPDLINLLKLSAYPNFFALLEKLPVETTLVQLQQWLEATPEKPPVETEEALNELRHYQTNHERLAEENKHNLLKLRHNYRLTLEKFKHGLEKLKPRFKTESPTPVQEIKVDPPTLYATLFLGFRYAVVSAIAATAIIYSALYLSALATFGCFTLAGWLIFPHLSAFFSWPEELENPATETSPLDEVIFVTFKENPLVENTSTPLAVLVSNELPKRGERVPPGDTLASVATSRGAQPLVETVKLPTALSLATPSAEVSTAHTELPPREIPQKEEPVLSSERLPRIGDLKCGFFMTHALEDPGTNSASSKNLLPPPPVSLVVPG